MAKNLDGIKKLTPEEIKENRKIVLKYIGEKDVEPTEPKNTAVGPSSIIKKVDGIKSRVSNIFNKPEPVVENQASKQKEINFNKEKAIQEKIKQQELVKKEIAEKAKLEAEEKLKAEAVAKKVKEQELAKQEIAENARRKAEEKLKAEAIAKKIKEEELAKKEINRRAKLLAEEKAREEAAKRWSEKIKLEEKAREEARIIKENKRLEKIKRQEEIKRIKDEIKSAKIRAKEKRKIKRQKAIKLFRKNLINKLNKNFSFIRQVFIYTILSLIICYVVFCLLVLRFKIDNNIINKIERFLPVPAVITTQGIINYYDFREIKNGNYTSLNLVDKKNSLAKWLILRNLSKKYNLPANSSIESLAAALVADKDFNQVGLSRIEKINELVKNVDNIEQLNKYADRYSDVNYYDSESAVKIFGQTNFNLNSNKISDVIFSKDGYYIAQIFDSQNGQLGIKYIFVGAAKTLDQYINEKLAKIKVFILAN